MIFIDSNVPMYLVGADHPNKELSRSALSRLVANAEVLVTDAEVLQEILHRYVAIDRRAAIDDAMAAIVGIIDEVFPIERTDVVRAKDVLVDSPLSARDALHVAVMRRHGVDRILTFDTGFDSAPDLVRLPET